MVEKSLQNVLNGRDEAVFFEVSVAFIKGQKMLGAQQDKMLAKLDEKSLKTVLSFFWLQEAT